MSALLIKDVRIFTGDAVIEDGWVFAEDGVISAVGSSSSQPPPTTGSDDVAVYSRPGHTLLPGLIDAHIHATDPLAIEQSIRFGVTTVLDMHNEPDIVAGLKKRAGQDMQVSDIKSACLAATVKGGWPGAIITTFDSSEESLAKVATWPDLKTPADVEAYVHTNRTVHGADYIKLMQESGTSLTFGTIATPSASLQRTVVESAHRHGLVAVGHALALADTLVLLDAGVDGTAHTFCDQPPTEEVVAKFAASGAWCNPTLAAVGSLTDEGREMQERFANDERCRDRLEKGSREALCKCMGFAKESARFEYAVQSVRALKAAGVDIICGSDAAGPALGTAWGISLHQELALLVEKCGFSPQDALNAATALPARRFGFEDRGLIAQGRRADLLLVEGDPLGDVGALLDARGVWRGGVMLGGFL